jgi:hypothetical protein
MDKRKRTTDCTTVQPPAKTPIPDPQTVPLDAITIRWDEGHPGKTLSGKQLERILDVVRWTDYDPGHPDHGGQFWLLASAVELGSLLRGLGQLLGNVELSNEADAPDARQLFLSSAQMLLSSCVMHVPDGEPDSSPCMYHVEVKAPAVSAAAGGVR